MSRLQTLMAKQVLAEQGLINMGKVRFDLATHDYQIQPDAYILPQEKQVNKTGKTDIAIKELFACQIATLDIEKTYTLSLFTKELSNHVGSTLKRRYGIFGWIILFIGKTFGVGTVGQLVQLERTFTTHLLAQKELLVQKLPQTALQDMPKLLKTLYLVDPSIPSGYKKVDALYKQMQETGLFSPSQTIQLAWYIEHKLQNQTHIKKDFASYLPRSLHQDLSSGRIFICQKGNQTPLAKTKGKIVTKALMLDRQQVTASAVAQLTTQDNVANIQKITLEEYKIAQEFTGQAGIWPMFHCAKYQKRKGEKVTEKVALFAPLGNNTFSNIAPNLSFDLLEQASITLLNGLKTIHARGYVHADIKGANALISTTSNSCGWIDFGMAGKVNDDYVKRRFALGIYGTIKYTPPEQLGVVGFCGDFAKADLWAFGLMLYRTHFKADPKWFGIIPEKIEGITYSTKEAYKKAIQAVIESPLARLLQKPFLTKQESFEVLIYKLLAVDPILRPSAEAALRGYQAGWMK